jgi:hypothetical protein
MVELDMARPFQGITVVDISVADIVKSFRFGVKQMNPVGQAPEQDSTYTDAGEIGLDFLWS